MYMFVTPLCFIRQHVYESQRMQDYVVELERVTVSCGIQVTLIMQLMQQLVTPRLVTRKRMLVRTVHVRSVCCSPQYVALHAGTLN